MNTYRLNSVDIGPSGRIPVLIPCNQSDAEGVAMHITSRKEAAKLGCVREIGLGALSLLVKDCRSFGRKYGAIPDKDRAELIHLLLLAKAIAANDHRIFELALKRLAAEPSIEFRRLALESQPGIELGVRLAQGLRGVELILWSKDEGSDLTILPGLRCRDVRSALYTLAVLSIEGGAGFGACVICGDLFVQLRRTRKTCSARCRYALHMQRKALKVTKERKMR